MMRKREKKGWKKKMGKAWSDNKRFDDEVKEDTHAFCFSLCRPFRLVCTFCLGLRLSCGGAQSGLD